MVKTSTKNEKTYNNLEESRSGFDAIGSVAIIKPSKKLKPAQIKLLAKNIMLKNKNIDGVFRKVGKIGGVERVQKLIWVAGSKNHLVIHKENGCSFYVDVKKVFFTPRLCSERARVSNLIEPKESVLDMFCGVGPYTIPIAKKAREVYAIDINKNAISLLKENLNLNKIKNVKVFCGDSKKTVKGLNKTFDRIIMNFPLAATDFLNAALRVIKDGGVIHLYTFLDTKKDYDSAVSREENHIKKLLPEGFVLKNISSHKAGEVAPYITRECMDMRIKRANNVRAIKRL